MYSFQEFLFWISILFVVYYLFISSIVYIKRHKDGKTWLGKKILNIDNELNKIPYFTPSPSPSPSPSSSLSLSSELKYDKEVDKIKKINDEINKINSSLPEINKNRLKPYKKEESECYKIKEERTKAKCSSEDSSDMYDKLMNTIKSNIQTDVNVLNGQ